MILASLQLKGGELDVDGVRGVLACRPPAVGLLGGGDVADQGIVDGHADVVVAGVVRGVVQGDGDGRGAPCQRSTLRKPLHFLHRETEKKTHIALT